MTSSKITTTPIILKPGTVCWTRRGSSSSSSSSSHDAQNNYNETSSSLQDDVESTNNLWWPCLIYPSWSYAATESRLMPNNNNSDDENDNNHQTTSSSILIQGCRKRIAKIHLSRNLVPQKAALGRKNNSLSKNRRVVAHLLGLSLKHRHVANWAAVDATSLKPYRRHALEMLSSYKDKLHRCDWIDFLRAMEEASVVLEDEAWSPRRLMEEMMEDGRGGGGTTPEFFDDWYSGGESQSQLSQRRSTSFSQAVRFDGGMGILNRNAAVSRGEERPPVDNDATPLVKNKKRPSEKMVRIVANVPGDLPLDNNKNDCFKSATGGAVSTVTPVGDDDDAGVSPPPGKRKRVEVRDGGVDGEEDRIQQQSSPASGERSVINSDLQDEECFPGSSLLTQPCADICEL